MTFGLGNENQNIFSVPTPIETQKRKHGKSSRFKKINTRAK